MTLSEYILSSLSSSFSTLLSLMDKFALYIRDNADNILLAVKAKAKDKKKQNNKNL